MDKIRIIAEQFSARKLQAEAQAWFKNFSARGITWLQGAHRKLQNVPKTNYDLGIKFASAGKLRDAQFRFQLALKISPDWAACWYQLGLCQMRQGNQDGAQESFAQVLRFDAAHADARYLLSVCNPRALAEGKRPTTMPVNMVQGFFESISARYNAQEAANHYQGAKVMVEALKPHLPTLSGLMVLDAGCGTGLASSLWRKVASQIIGVDITAAMCARAREAVTADKSPLLDQVIHADIRALRQYVPPHSQQVILCANVLQFVGDLDATFAEFSACLDESGVIGITLEPFSAQGYGVVATTGRFGHSAAYVAAMATKHGLQVVAQQNVQLYPKMPALCFVLRHAPVATQPLTS